MPAAAWSSRAYRVRTAMQAARYLPHAVKLPAIEWIMRRR